VDYYLKQDPRNIDLRETDQGILQVNRGDNKLTATLQATTGPYATFEDIREVQSARQTMLNFRRISGDDPVLAITGIAPHWPLRKVLEPNFNVQALRDKIVLIGSIQPGKDSFLTPLSRNRTETVHGVYLHAHAISQLLDRFDNKRPLITYWQRWQEGLWIAAWSIGAGLLVWRWLRPLWVGIGGTVLLLTAGVVLFNGLALWVPLVPAIAGLWVSIGLASWIRKTVKIFCKI
jgi:CHASE2 domain-containing sensor protein